MNELSYQGGKYIGDTKNGKPDGYGEITWNNGEKYQGSWAFGKKHGSGTFCDLKGNKFIGKWHEDLLNGKVVYIEKAGFVYECKYKMGSMKEKICRINSTDYEIENNKSYKHNSLINDLNYLDASKGIGYSFREDGRFGSHPSYDNYGEESYS